MVDNIDLNTFPDLTNLGGTQRTALLERARVDTIAKGDNIYLEGDPATDVCFVISGRIDLEAQTMRGTPIVLDVLGPGDLLGWSACLGMGNATATSHCQSDTHLLRIEGSMLRELLEQDSSRGLLVMTDIAKTVARRLRESRNRLTHLLGDMV